jgi:hypothetical protein
MSELKQKILARIDHPTLSAFSTITEDRPGKRSGIPTLKTFSQVPTIPITVSAKSPPAVSNTRVWE